MPGDEHSIPLLTVTEAINRGAQVIPLDGSPTIQSLYSHGFVVVTAGPEYYAAWKRCWRDTKRD